MIPRLLRRILFNLVLIAVIWAAGFGWFMLQIPRSADSSEARADAIIVLTGGSGRIEYGLKLLSEGRAQKLFISGVEAKNVPALKGHPELSTRVYLGYEARNTIGNAQEVLRFVDSQKIKSIRLVTADYHMPRALAELRFALPDATIIPDPVMTDFSLKIALDEYHKAVAARLRHFLISTVEERL